MRFVILPLALALGLKAVQASACPAVPDRSGEVAQLVDAVRAAATEAEALAISDKFWDIWATAPDAKAQRILDRGLSRRQAGNLPAAKRAFDELVDYCPHYAEGYNQRAFVHYLQGAFALALPDLDAALLRDPDHIAALSGRALTLFGLGRAIDARATLRAALALNPWLPERAMLERSGAGETDL